MGLGHIVYKYILCAFCVCVDCRNIAFNKNKEKYKKIKSILCSWPTSTFYRPETRTHPIQHESISFQASFVRSVFSFCVCLCECVFIVDGWEASDFFGKKVEISRNRRGSGMVWCVHTFASYIRRV